MTRVTGRILLLTVCALALATGGCRSTGSQTTAPTTGSEFDQGAVPPKPASKPRSTNVELGTVYFDFDSYNIRSDARPVLRSNAEIIKDRNWRSVTIEGHCDERGSEEYNLALGERRANAVKQYLVDLGVPSSRLRTVSFGEAKPAVRGHDESAWRYNRRSEIAP